MTLYRIRTQSNVEYQEADSLDIDEAGVLTFWRNEGEDEVEVARYGNSFIVCDRVPASHEEKAREIMRLKFEAAKAGIDRNLERLRREAAEREGAGSQEPQGARR